MKALLACIAASLLVCGCGGEVCNAHSNENFNRLLVKRLANEGIKATERKDKSEVCFAKSEAKKVAAISADFARHFRAAGTYIVDECQEEPLVKWAKDNNLDYALQDFAQAGGRRKGKAFYLHSTTAQEAEANKEKLRAAPRGKVCHPLVPEAGK